MTWLALKVGLSTKSSITESHRVRQVKTKPNPVWRTGVEVANITNLSQEFSSNYRCAAFVKKVEGKSLRRCLGSFKGFAGFTNAAV